jgi:glycosyltransferase involved in cell wall biosynthesis
VKSFSHGASRGYYLIVSEMVSYKRLDVAVRAFAKSGRKLKIAGGGPEYGALKRLAAPNIEFCGRVSGAQLRELYAGSAALIVPCEEDFGITMVESLASGKPVIAVARGGAMEIVQNGCGLLYDDAGPESLEQAITAFEHVENRFNPGFLIESAARFSEERFEAGIRAVLNGRGVLSRA